MSYRRRLEIIIALKVSKYGVFSGPYFPLFGLNTEIYRINLRIRSEYMKMHTRKNSTFGHISCIVSYLIYLKHALKLFENVSYTSYRR